MKKKISLILSTAMIVCALYSIDVDATTNTNENIENILGEVYSKKTITLPPATYNNSEEYIPQEYSENIEALNDLYNLEPKTDSKYEIALSNNDGTYTYLQSEENLEDAISYINNMKKTQYNEENSIPCIIDSNGEVVYSTNSMGKIIKYINGKPYPSKDKNTSIYSSYENGQLKSEYTYVNHGYIDDVPIIEDKGKAAKIEIAGYRGWVNKDTSKSDYDLRVVPMNQVKNPSYYKNNNGVLEHYISANIESSSSGGHTIKIGKAPSFMNQGVKYYSYDGNYFYTSLDTLVSDAKQNHHNNSVNKNDKYHSYYLYLPFRSKTFYNANQINTFINNNTKSDSKLRNIGESLISAQDKYGVNASMILSVAINESGWGTSTLAKTKNNLFGIKAFDSNVSGASSFKTPGDSVIEFAKNYISKGYANPKDWRYKGAHLGNKALGANVKYASDPFWGEKATQYTYRLDYQLSGNQNENLKDYDKYSLGVHSDKNSIVNKDNNNLYNINSELVGTPTVLLSNKNYDGYNKILPDRPTNINQDFDGVYDLQHEAYTKSSGIKTINDAEGFKDIKGHWAEKVINEFIDKGYISGYADGTFKPNRDITRAEFVKITNHVFKFTKKEEKYFSDVKETDWFYEELKVAIAAGYINGYDDNTFRPNKPISREEVASIMTTISKNKDGNLDKSSQYNDFDKVSKWAQSSVEGAIEAKFMGGYSDNTFRPKNNITRAEAVSTLSRVGY